MALYSIEILQSAEKEARKIDTKQLTRIVEAISILRHNPFTSNTKKLKGSDSCYGLRVGHYRILYEIDTSKKQIVVYRIRHRKDVYK